MGRARLQLSLQAVEVEGQNYDVRTISHPRIGRDHKKRNLVWIGGGAAGGAVIGALAGGGTGALIGGPVGAGAGTTVALLTGKKDIHLSAETPVTFKLAEPVTIKVKG
jgi:outer membrane lipoprotein SlyB